MKTNRIIIAALFISAAVSCQKEGFGGSENACETESATIVAGEMTRTSLNGNEVHWTFDDVIAVYDNFGYKNEFNVLEASASYAAFSGEVTAGTTQIYAVYPYQLAGAVSGSTVNVTIPVDQTSKVGSFAEEHNISVAKGTKTPGVEKIENITFKNVVSYLKFTIPSYIEDAKSVTFSTSRAIAGTAAVDASADTPVAVVGENGSNSVTMTGSYPAGSQFMFVLSSGEIQGFTVTVATDKATWSITRSTVVSFEPGQYKNLGTLELEQVVGATASAAHTYSDNTLTGTTVNVALDVPAATQHYATDFELVVKNAAGTVVRSVSSSAISASQTLAATTDWPYLPQGTYTVSGSYKLGETVKTISATFTSPAPTFAVTSNAYSSYTKYNANQSSVANTLAADQIYDINKASVTISSDILNNANYSGIIGGYTYKLDNAATTATNATGQALGSHTVTATYTFDGVANSGSSNCHITGLPYTLNVSGNDSVSPWSEEGYVNWDESGSVKLGHNQWGGEAYIQKSFNLPANVNIEVDCAGDVYGTGSWIKVENTFSLVISGNTIASSTCKGNSGVSFSHLNKTATMTSANPTIKCNSSYNLERARVLIKSLKISYGTK